MSETLPDYGALQGELFALFAAEGLMPETRGDWVLVDDAFPALRAHVHGGVLSVELSLYDGRRIREAFPASGGMALFRDGVFRVLLSAFWGRHNPGQVAREVWKRADGPWLAMTGPYQREVATGDQAPVPYPLFGAVRSFVQDQHLDEDLHWLSLQASIADGEADVAVQFDNLPQPELADRLSRLVWPRDGRIHTLRNFILLARS